MCPLVHVIHFLLKREFQTFIFVSVCSRIELHELHILAKFGIENLFMDTIFHLIQYLKLFRKLRFEYGTSLHFLVEPLQGS